MRAILKQTSWLFLAQGLSRVIGFFYTIFLAKNLGVEGFGLLTVALAYFAIISTLADFGFNRFLIREIARDKLKTSQLLCNILMLRLTLTAIAFAFFAVGLYILDQDKIRVSLILLTLLAILPQAAALTFDGIFIAMRNLKFSAVSLTLASLSTVLLGVYLVSMGLGTIGAVNALIFGQLVYTLVLLGFLYKFKLLSISPVTFSILKKVLAGSLPYGLLGVLGLIYFRIDAVMLSYMRGSFETGLYGAAYRFLEAIVFIPTALGTALFPVMAKLQTLQVTQIKTLYVKSMKIMTFISLIIVFGYVTVLPIIIKEFLPSYLPSIDAVKILALAIPFMFLHVPASSFVLSSEKYLKPIIFLSLIPLSFNILMNLIFIPLYGFIAASWITVFSDILSFLLIFMFIQKYVFKKA